MSCITSGYTPQSSLWHFSVGPRLWHIHCQPCQSRKTHHLFPPGVQHMSDMRWVSPGTCQGPAMEAWWLASGTLPRGPARALQQLPCSTWLSAGTQTASAAAATARPPAPPPLPAPLPPPWTWLAGHVIGLVLLLVSHPSSGQVDASRPIFPVSPDTMSAVRLCHNLPPSAGACGSC